MKCGGKCKERAFLNNLLIDELNDVGSERGPRATGVKIVKVLEAVCEFGNVAVGDVFASRVDVCVELVGSFCREWLPDRGQCYNSCCSTRYSEEEVFASGNIVAFDGDLKLF